MIKNLANFQKKIGINFKNQKLLTKMFLHIKVITRLIIMKN